MSKSIPNVDWANQLESVIRQFVKEKLELIMREEMKSFLEIEQAGTNGLPGLEEAFKTVYPKADVQRCVVHKVRNTLSRVRKKDQFEVAEDLKLIFCAPNKEIALQMFQLF
ncbi:mutator family transposase [Aeribacillus composti]|nr:mutator family transposase [Aeribacillus composti]